MAPPQGPPAQPVCPAVLSPRHSVGGLLLGELGSLPQFRRRADPGRVGQQVEYSQAQLAQEHDGGGRAHPSQAL